MDKVLALVGVINGLGMITMMLYLIVTTKKFDFRKLPLSKFGTFKETGRKFNAIVLVYGIGQFIFVWQIYRALHLTSDIVSVGVLLSAALFTSAIGLAPMHKNHFLHGLFAALGILLSNLTGWLLDYYLYQTNPILGITGFIVSITMTLWLLGYVRDHKLRAGNEFGLLVLIFLWNIVFTLALV